MTTFLDPSNARQGDIDIADYAEAVTGFRAVIADAKWTPKNYPEDLARRIVNEVP